MSSDTDRKLPEREEKINHLIDEDRFDLFDYLTVLVYIPGGASRLLINFRIFAVSFHFLYYNSSKAFYPLASSKEKQDRESAGGALSRVLTPHQGSRPVGLRGPFHPPHTKENKALQAQSLRAAS